MVEDLVAKHLIPAGRLLSISPLLKVLNNRQGVPKFAYLDQALQKVFDKRLKLLIFSSHISVPSVITEVDDSVSMLSSHMVCSSFT